MSPADARHVAELLELVQRRLLDVECRVCAIERRVLPPAPLRPPVEHDDLRRVARRARSAS